MKYLYDCFHDSISAKINNNGGVLIGETTFHPVEILKSDDEAYENEYLNWRDTTWLPLQMSRLNTILKIDNNEMRFHDLNNALMENRLVPFIGSGMSAPSGLPVWSDFLYSLGCQSRINLDYLTILLSANRYEEAADKITSLMPRMLFDEQVEQKLRLLDSYLINGPINHLPELFQSIVITTNLDNLLELLYQSRGADFSHVIIGDEIRQSGNLSMSSNSFLLKLHGDCFSATNRVLTKADYDNAYNQNTLCMQELGKIFYDRQILFLGCSLEKDRILDFFEQIAKNNDNLLRHYCFLQHPGSNNDRIDREHFLTEHGIFPIWYNGDHNESIEALFVGMLQAIGKLEYVKIN